MTIFRLFLRFLKIKNVYANFICNSSTPYYKDGSFMFENTIESICGRPPSYYINDAFRWDKTKEGQEFWNTLHVEWWSLLKELDLLSKTSNYSLNYEQINKLKKIWTV
jgi:hypothetical protein